MGITLIANLCLAMGDKCRLVCRPALVPFHGFLRRIARSQTTIPALGDSRRKLKLLVIIRMAGAIFVNFLALSPTTQGARQLPDDARWFYEWQ